eukprot:10692291-Lingulodinium_polyedra.AAC.1
MLCCRALLSRDSSRSGSNSQLPRMRPKAPRRHGSCAEVAHGRPSLVRWPCLRRSWASAAGLDQS